MLILPKKHYLRNLREIDIDNLRCGRITNVAVREAMNRTTDQLTANKFLEYETVLADELNDMLEAAK